MLVYQTFNSGRWYGNNGQWITFIPYNNGVIFCDHTRQVRGVIEQCNQTPSGLLEAYDCNLYEYPMDDEYADRVLRKMDSFSKYLDWRFN